MIKVLLVCLGLIVLLFVALSVFLVNNPQLLQNAFEDISSGLNNGDDPRETCNVHLIEHEQQLKLADLSELYEKPVPLDMEHFCDARLKATAKYLLELRKGIDLEKEDYHPLLKYATPNKNQSSEPPILFVSDTSLIEYDSLEKIEKLLRETPAALPNADGVHWNFVFGGGVPHVAKFDFIQEYKNSYPKYADPANYKQHVQ